MSADRLRHLLPAVTIVTMAMIAFLVARPKTRIAQGTREGQASNPGSIVITREAEVRQLPVMLGIVAIMLSAGGLAAGLSMQQSHKRGIIARELTGGNPDNAGQLATRYGCSGCHAIPGLPGADGQVAPSLAGLRHRVFIGGVLRNNAENLVNWIVAPQQTSPRSAMPPTGISEAEARDIAAYLYAN
jgi:cytochrome c